MAGKETKNPVLKALIEDLKAAGLKNPIWKATAKALSRPNRKTHEVNLFNLEKNADPKMTALVPGNVLGSGEISKKIDVAALRFSSEAKAKIEKAGGSCMTIRELMEKKPEGKDIRIMG